NGRPARVFYNGTDLILLNPPSLSTTGGGTVTGQILSTLNTTGPKTGSFRSRQTDNTSATKRHFDAERGNGTGVIAEIATTGDTSNGVAQLLFSLRDLGGSGVVRSMIFDFANGRLALPA